MKKCKIYYTSDVHGYFYPTTYGDMEAKSIGLFGCAPEFKKDDDTLIIDGGDNLQGSALAYYCRQTLNSNDYIAEMMNEAGYDYSTIGNHDFNFGQEYQKNYIKKCNAKFVCENVLDADGNKMYPYDICVMKNGLRIGIVGIVTDFVNIWEKKQNLVGVQVVDPVEAARKALEELKGKTDFNICIYHGGFECDLKTGEIKGRQGENYAYKICKELDFEVLLTGHQHMSVDGQYLFGTYTLQPLGFAKEYQYLEIEFDNGIKNITSKKCDSNPKLGENLRNKYQALENDIQNWLNQPAGRLSRSIFPEDKLVMAQKGSPIADLINKIMLDVSGADISVTSLANDVTGFKAEVTTRDIIATYPYSNTLFVIKATGKAIKAAMERSAEYFTVTENGLEISKSFLDPKVEHYNYDYFYGIEYQIDPEKEIGSRVHDIRFNGKELKDSDELKVVLNNYRFSGAGGYPMWPECEVVQEINTEMVDIIMDFFAKNDYIEV